VIPEAAVEAALEAFYAKCDIDFDGLHAVRAALEAAAPFMEEAAYSRGFDDGHLAGQESMEAE